MNIKIGLLIIYLSVISNLASSVKWTNDFNNIDLLKIENQLLNNTVIDSKCVYKSDTAAKVFLINLSENIQAIFKPLRGDLAIIAEVAAYKICKFINSKLLVPPTVLRTIDGQLGSLQLYLGDTDRSVKFDSLSPRLKSEVNLFNFIIGKIDWNPKNHANLIMKMSGKKSNIALIDNATICFLKKSIYGKYFFWRYQKIDISKLNSNLFCVSGNNDKTFPFHLSKPFTQEMSLALGLPEKWAYGWGRFYIIHQNYIWFQQNDAVWPIGFTKIYSKKALEGYKKLNKNILLSLWNGSDHYYKNEEYINELCDEIIKRVNQVLAHSKKSRIL